MMIVGFYDETATKIDIHSTKPIRKEEGKAIVT